MKGNREANGNQLQCSCWRIPWAEEPGRLLAVCGVAQSRTRLSDFTFTFHFHALEEEMATHSSVLAWGIPGTGEPGGLPSMGLHRVRRDWRDLAVWEEKGQRRSNFWGSKTVSPVWDELRGKCQELVICDSRLQQVQKPAGGDASCFLKEIETSSV